MEQNATKQIDQESPLYNWQDGFEQQLEFTAFNREIGTLRAPNVSRLDRIARKADKYRENLFKQEALKLTLEKRIERNLHPIIFILAMCMLAASNLFFGQIPGSIGLLWVATVVFSLFITYRLIADVEDEAVLSYKKLASGLPD